MRLKKTEKKCSVIGIRPETCIALMVAENVYRSMQLDGDMIVTSITDGKHSLNSLHYVGFAFDLRIPLERKEDYAAELRLALTDEFDVLAEGDHVHVEFQPKFK
jgi:hypothetical protein